MKNVSCMCRHEIGLNDNISFNRVTFSPCLYRKKSLGGGSVLELGVYPIQFSQFIFGDSFPKSIKAKGTLNDDGIDLDMYAELNYGGNKVGKVTATGIASPENTAIITGTKGSMTVKQIQKIFLNILNL